VQGTGDPIDPRRFTTQFFRAAPQPKFLLELLGAGHFPPNTTDGRELTIVEDVTIAFLDHYVKGRSISRVTKPAAGPGLTRLVSDG
jgi:fermentation-respiration switch protein FrsA (DUF1100 family)